MADEEEKVESYSISGLKVEIKDFATGCSHCGRFGMVKDETFGVDRCTHCGTLQKPK
jgi:ribosomal protein L37AE/L43A